MSMRSHDDYKENIGPYVLGALPELEAEVLERHLAGCETCRSEVQELQPVAGALARSVPQVDPPPSLKASLMAVVHEEAQLRNPEAARSARAPKRRRLPGWLGGLQPRMAAAGALAVLALGVVIGVAADELGGGTERTVAVRVDRTLMPTGAASLRIENDGQKASLRLRNAPAPPRGKVYKLWVQHGQGTKPVGGPAIAKGGDLDASIPGGVTNANAVMVTVERDPDAQAPTSKPIMTVNL